MTDRAFGDAAQQQSTKSARTVRADRDQIVAAALSRVRDHRHRRTLDQVDVQWVAEPSVAGDEFVGLRFHAGENGIAEGVPRESRLTK